MVSTIEWIGIAGSAASLLGLVAVGIQAERARRAAVGAQSAANEARAAVFQRETANDMASLMNLLTQIRDAARSNRPDMCIVRIEQASEVAARLKARDDILGSEAGLIVLQSTLSTLQTFEYQLESTLQAGATLELENMLPQLGELRSALATVDEALR